MTDSDTSDTDTTEDPSDIANADTDRTSQRSFAGYPVALPKIRDPRLRLSVVTTTLHVLGQVTFNFNLSIAQILVSLLAAGAVEFTVTFKRQKVIAWPASALLTGNGVALILRIPGTEHGDWWSMRGWYIFAATSALAVASKYVIRWRGAHIFNPSNFMLVLVFIALGEQRVDPQILWWGPWSLGLAIAFVVILVGSIAITLQVGQMGMAISFWVTFAALISVITLSGHAITANWHIGPLQGWAYWFTLVASPEVMVFLFYMITDPKASPSTARGKVIFGFSVAVASAVFVSAQTTEFGTKVGILAGLVVMCPFVPLINARTGAATTQPSSALTFTTRQAGMTAAALLVSAGVVFGLSSTRSFESPGASTASALERRSEVTLNVDVLPKVKLDDSAARSAFKLTPELAKKIAADAATDLAIEAQAVTTLDSELASAGITGQRLTAVDRAIRLLAKDKNTPPPMEVAYQFDKATVTVIKPDDGPQTPPELAVRIEGNVRGPGGSVALDDYFMVTRVKDFYLISGALSSDRKPLTPAPLDARVTNMTVLDPDSDAEITAPSQPATAEELAGLQLVDKAAEMGLTLPHSRYGLGEQQNFKIGGAAVGDVNNDGRPDIFVTRVGYPNVLYRNDGTRFTDITVDAGLSDVATDTAIDGGSTAAMLVDLNGDGNLDLVTLGMAGTPNRLFVGNGSGDFTDESARWGIPSPSDTVDDPADNSLAVGLAAADFDHDGNVDLLLLAAEPDRIHRTLADNKVTVDDVCSDSAKALINGLSSAASSTVLLRNTGTGLEDVTQRLGVDPSHLSAASARFVDLDGDGWDDLIITGDSCTTKVLHNDNGTFVDATKGSAFDQVPYATGVATVDLNRDGAIDIVLGGASFPSGSGRCSTGVSGYSCSTNRVLVNDGTGSFTDQSNEQMVQFSGWTWGIAAADFNNDSFDDLYATTGTRTVQGWWDRANPSDKPPFDWSNSPDYLWIGAGSAPMRSTEVESVITDRPEPAWGRAAIPADFDGDGKMDLLVIDTAHAPSLLMNTTSNTNHWLGVRLKNTASPNTAGLGATVTIESNDGRTWVQRIGAEGSYQSSGPASTHFGLGSTADIKSVTIRWIDGSTQTVEVPEVDQWLTIERLRAGR